MAASSPPALLGAGLNPCLAVLHSWQARTVDSFNAQLAFLVGIFAIGTAVGELLKDMKSPVVRDCGRGIKFSTGFWTGALGIGAAYSTSHEVVPSANSSAAMILGFVFVAFLAMKLPRSEGD